MKNLLLLVILFPCIGNAQEYLHEGSRIFNVYHKSQQVILKYGKEYIENHPMFEIVSENADSIVTEFSFAHDNKNSCLEGMKVTAKMVIAARETRTRISFNDAKYSGAKGLDKCLQSGYLYELAECKQCKAAILAIKEQYKNILLNNYEDYKNFLKTKTNDGQW